MATSGGNNNGFVYVPPIYITQCCVYVVCNINNKLLFVHFGCHVTNNMYMCKTWYVTAIIIIKNIKKL